MFRAYFIKKSWLIAGALLLVAIIALIIWGCNYSRTVRAFTSSTSFSWGLKRNNDHKTPDASKNGAQLLASYGGLYVGDENQPKVYLTFDEGYEAGHTPAVLDILKEKQVRAVFFICGGFIDSEPELVKRMYDEGHDVGNHTDQHKNPIKLNDDEIRKDITDLADKVKQTANKSMRFYRPPEGNFDDRTLGIAKDEGLTTLMWSWAYNDWEKPKGAEYVCKLALDNVHNGAVYLFHLTTPDAKDSLPTIIDDIRAAGYSFGDPGELLSYSLEGQ